jgi:uncharacterized membrane protein YbhN (UPF0104 family)
VQRWLPARWHALIDDICAEYVSSKGTLWGALALSVVSNLFVFGGFLAAARVLHYDMPASVVFLSGPIITLANSIPLTPGGIGVGEATSQQLLATMNSQGGAEMMMLFRLVTILLTLPAALLVKLPNTRR